MVRHAARCHQWSELHLSAVRRAPPSRMPIVFSRRSTAPEVLSRSRSQLHASVSHVASRGSFPALLLDLERCSSTSSFYAEVAGPPLQGVCAWRACAAETVSEVHQRADEDGEAVMSGRDLWRPLRRNPPVSALFLRRLTTRACGVEVSALGGALGGPWPAL